MVHDILQRWVPNYEIWVFGSRVHQRGLKPFSDLDLALITDEPLDNSRYGMMKEAFIESDLPFRVDVVDWSLLNDSFKAIIRKEHERL
jgi:predicted nucleotidyltransferase